MKEYYFIYETENGGRIRIKAKKQPGINTIPARGSWVLQEFVKKRVQHGFFTQEFDAWEMPCFPEITWGTLRKLSFLRKEPI